MHLFFVVVVTFLIVISFYLFQEQSLLKLVKLLEDVSTSSSTSSLEKQTALYGIKLIVARVDRKSKAFSKVSPN